MKQATTLAGILQSCDPHPLRKAELADFFVSTADARDPVISRRDELQKRLERNPDDNSKLLLCGHSGCGKSTELVKLAEEIESTFFTVSFSVAQECNLFHVPVEDVLVVMMERLLDACHERGLEGALSKSDESLEAIYEWSATELDIKEQKTIAGGVAEGGVDTSGSFLGKTLGLYVKLKASISRADKRVHRTTIEKPHRLGELADRCDILIKAVKIALKETDRRLLIVIEDLDKVNLTDARRIFLEQPGIMGGLHCNIICTVPIFLLHSPEHSALDQHFTTVELPMLKVVKFDGEHCDEGRGVIRQIIAKRVGEGLIDKDALELLIDKSGGVLRDVFEVLVVGAGAAESLFGKRKQKAVITTDNIRYALNRRKTEYARAITTIDLPEDYKLSTTDLYDKLREVKDGPVRILPSEPATMVLLKARAIIEYNGEGWFAVHPLVVELLDSTPE